ncbi:hypothetical protein [Streptomyces sp. bgisy084]|uniref:hypothetical protein n=1 Tax=unclassified Streptomyces TaxID=2593676 RepID=UPI003D715098
MSNREGERLHGWIADVCADEQCGLASFATGLLSGGCGHLPQPLRLRTGRGLPDREDQEPSGALAVGAAGTGEDLVDREPEANAATASAL